MSDTHVAPEGHSSAQRPLALVILVAAGVLSLPVSAAFLDGEDTDDWILPAALVVMAVVGAVVGGLLPGIAGRQATTNKGRGVGALVGVVVVLLGTLVYYVLLDG